MPTGTKTAVRAGLLLTVAAGVVLSVTGCSSSGTAVRDYQGEPKGVAAPPSSAGGAPFAVWMDQGDEFAITMYGSSACPPVASAFHVIGANKLKIALEPVKQKQCRNDYTPHTSMFRTPSAIRRASGLTIVIPDSGVGSLTIKLPGYVASSHH